MLIPLNDLNWKYNNYLIP